MGRPQKFGEPTEKITIRVPFKKKEFYKKHIYNLLDVLNSIDNERSIEEHINNRENN